MRIKLAKEKHRNRLWTDCAIRMCAQPLCLARLKRHARQVERKRGKESNRTRAWEASELARNRRVMHWVIKLSCELEFSHFEMSFRSFGWSMQSMCAVEMRNYFFHRWMNSRCGNIMIICGLIIATNWTHFSCILLGAAVWPLQAAVLIEYNNLHNCPGLKLKIITTPANGTRIA